MAAGVFITFEGGEGSGKSTQLKLLEQALVKANIQVVATREPGGTPEAEKIRKLLVEKEEGINFEPMTEALLMFAARREHLAKKILPAIAEGKWVVSDRFADSSRVYQGYSMGLDMATIEKLYGMVAGEFEPNLTLIFDIDPKIGLMRSLKFNQETGSKEDKYEKLGLTFHQKIREGFLEVARKNPERCVVLDASSEIADMHREVLKVVGKRFGVELKAVV